MQNDTFLDFRIVAAVIFFASLYAGYYIFSNHRKLFGVDPEMPSEASSSRSYSRLLVIALWAHVQVASGAAALLLH